MIINMVKTVGHWVEGKAVQCGSGLAVVSSISLTAVNNANAALDPSIATAMTTLQADATSLLGLVFPVVLSIFAMLTGIKLFKRFGSKV